MLCTFTLILLCSGWNFLGSMWTPSILNKLLSNAFTVPQTVVKMCVCVLVCSDGRQWWDQHKQTWRSVAGSFRKQKEVDSLRRKALLGHALPRSHFSEPHRSLSLTWYVSWIGFCISSMNLAQKVFSFLLALMRNELVEIPTSKSWVQQNQESCLKTFACWDGFLGCCVLDLVWKLQL